ncbi:MAG: FAD-dependent oxidoreductase [Betaproteobacteria bacterium]|nr:FAD-dependent oxidoreductase [Betaproteobacteria bacterium]
MGISRSSHVLVAGGSLGGLMAANMLHRAGHQVTVLEKAMGSLDGRGAGIVTHRLLVKALERCGIPPETPLGVAINKRVVLSPSGDIAEHAPINQVLTSWSRLYALLVSVLPAECYCQGATVQEVEQSSDRVTVSCEDGRHFHGDVLVASDGIRSMVRQQLAPKVQVQYAGYVAWRGVCDEAVLSKRTLDTVFETFGFGLPEREQLIGYPVAGSGNSVAKGQRRYNFVWYRPAADDGTLQSLMTDADGIHHPHGLSPNKVHYQHVAAVRRAAHDKMAPQFAEILEKTAQPFLQPIYDCASDQIAFDRVALMGDASFVARPHVGMGVTKAAEDAMALADGMSLHGATPQALLAYEQARLRPCKAVVNRARRLGAYMQNQSVARDDYDVMVQTAIDLSDMSLDELEQARPMARPAPQTISLQLEPGTIQA